MSSERLDSWKRIAGYLKRSVRTVRRWEREEGLPVHRHMHRSLASVFALRAEIDAWQQSLARSPQAAGDADRELAAIAVLPFANLCANAETNAYFVDGLTEEVTSTLSAVAGLRVISRTSAAALRGTRKGVRAIARQLQVRYLLQGSVRREAGRLRIAAQLIEADKDQHLWSEIYEGTLEDVFAMQERLARRITAALQLRLSAADTARLAARDIGNVAAYECYLRARYEGWRWRRDAIDRAVQLLQQALALAGESARLYAALGRAHLQYREAGIDLGPRPLDAAAECAARVVALDAACTDGLQLRGWIHYSRGRIQEAVRDLKTALAAEPHNADSLLLLCNCYLISGRIEAARSLLRRLLAVDPLTPITRCMPAFADVMEGKLGSAIAPYRQMLEMDPGNPVARLFYVWVLVLNRRTAQARAVIRTFPREVRDTLPARVAQFLACAAVGERRAAQVWLTPPIEALAGASDFFPRFLAQGFALAGARAAALKWLRIAVKRGFINYPYLARHDPSFGPLRRDARFRALLARVRKRWEAFEA